MNLIKSRESARRGIGAGAGVAAAILSCWIIAVAGAGEPADGGGWRSLFDGRTLAGWRAYAGPGATRGPIGEGWKVEDGILKKRAGVRGGDILTEETFDDFEFSWEWRIAPLGNSGVKYFVTEARKGAPGHEYQMLDDEDARWASRPAKIRTASFYEVLAPAADKPYRRAGEWNESRIVVRGNRVEHWLNGRKVLEYEAGSAAVREAVGQSKFAKHPDFGTKIRGPILLTDHQDEAWFRNLRVRVPR